MIGLIIKSLQLLGFWSHTGHGHNYLRALFLVFMVAMWIVVPGLAFVFLHEPDFAADMGALIEVIIVGFVVPQASIFLLHRQLLERTYREMKTALTKASADMHLDVQTVLRQLESFSSWVFKGYIGSEVVVACLYVLSIPLIILIKYATTGILPPLRAVFEADYIIFDHEHNLLVWLATVIVSFYLTLHLVFFLILSHSFFWIMLHNVSGLFKIVRMKISRLNEIADEGLRHEEFVEIVNLQETAYRSSRSLESALNVLMLILYGGCVVEICMAMTALSVASDDKVLLLKMVLVLIYTFFHIFIYSLLGTEMISTSTSTAEAFYVTKWYQQTVQEQRLLLLALTRSQKMAYLTTGKFFLVNRITFGMTLRSAVQYYTVLRQAYESQQ